MEGVFSMKMKRKDLEEVNDDFSEFSLSSPARKIRRLDAELPPIIEEEEPAIPVDMEESYRGNHFAGGLEQVGGLVIEEMPSDPLNNEKAIVLFNPMNTSIERSPTSFSISSDILSGFKNQIWSSKSSSIKVMEDEDAAQDRNTSGCLAVVPWVPSQFSSMLGQEVSQTEVPEVMEAEEVGEAMEIEGSSISIEQGQANEFGGIRGNEGLNQWHCLTPQLPQNTSPPIVWYR